MDEGFYETKCQVQVIVPMEDGTSKEAKDTLTLTVLYTKGKVLILQIRSKLDRGFVNLPPDMLREITRNLLETAKIL